MQILKLGGSVITHKDEYFSPHMENITRLAQEIAEAVVDKLIIIHGGGSFGHPVAKKYDIHGGLKTRDQLTGFSKTHQAMARLNQIIVDALLDAGVPAFSVSPSSMLITEAKRITQTNFDTAKRLVEIGLVPVLYGDAVLDSKQGIAILSGDQLAAALARSLGATRVIYGSDVDGIYTSNPKIDPDAELLETVSINKVTAHVGDTTFTDVTGGMLGKLKEAEAALKGGVEVLFINASAENRVKQALMGEKVIGTRLTM